MEKPIVFFSHSSRDQACLAKAKELFVEKTGGTIDVFLSSDGQSIPFGRNWVHRIEESLRDAKIMFIWVTPNSLGSNWIYFESGVSYGKGVRVIPLGFMGVTIGSLNPPLNLLQGFNVDSSDSLNNLIAIVNDEFGHNHNQQFSDADYQLISSLVGAHSSSTLFGPFASCIDKLFLGVPAEGLNCDVSEVLGQCAKYLTAKGIEHQERDDGIALHGAVILPKTKESDYFQISIEPYSAGQLIPLLESMFLQIRSRGVGQAWLRCDFRDTVRCVTDRTALSGRLLGLGVGFGDQEWLTFQSIKFNTFVSTHAHFRISNMRTIEHLSFSTDETVFSLGEIGELFGLMVDREVIAMSG